MDKGEFLFSKEHTWVRIEEDGTVTVGISHFIANELEEVSHVDLPKTGQEVEQFETIAVIEGLNDIFDVYSPISGKIIEVNDALIHEPNIVAEDPYGDGWIVVMKPSDPEEFERLMPEDEYNYYIESLTDTGEEPTDDYDEGY